MNTLKRIALLLILAAAALPGRAQVSFTVVNLSGPNMITCTTTSLQFQASSNLSGVSYSWTGPAFNTTGSLVTITSPGNYSVTAVSGSSTSTQTFSVSSIISPPSATLSPASQTIGCLASSVTQVTVVSSNTNCSVSWLNAQGGNVMAGTTPAFYLPGVGTHTCVVTDNTTGCSTALTLTATTSSFLPTFQLTSTTNFSIGCGNASVSAVQIINAQSTVPPGGGPVLFSLLNPAGTPVIGPGGQSSYMMSIPGNWSVIVKDAISNCESRVYFSVQQNVTAPQLSAVVPTQVLDCNSPQVMLQASSSTPNTGFTWNFTNFPSPVPGSVIQATTNVAAPTSTIADTYTLVATNLWNLCKTSTVIPIYQNIFPPVVAIGVNSPAACQQTVVLNNGSSTGIPGGVFPNGASVVATLWEGPAPQVPAALSSTYLAQTSGVYTLTATDQNNGCSGKAMMPINLAQVTAAFVHTITGAQANFNDVSVGTVAGASYYWDFGDGNTSTLQNPVHNYTNAGAYLVKLKVTNPASLCPDSSIQSVNISGIPCVANSGFSMVPTGTAQVWNVVPSYPWNVTAAKWSWGDGQVSNTMYTSHQYASAGMYNICLSVTVSCGDTSSTCTTYSVYRGTQEAAILQVNVVAPALISGLAAVAADAQLSWNIVPNPNSGEFRVTIGNKEAQTVRMMISDLTGRVVYDQPDAASQSAHSCNLPPGMYLVTLEAEGIRTTKRMMVYR